MFKNKKCLICGEEIDTVFSWKNIWYTTNDEKICNDCKGKLEFLSRERCRMCSRELEEKYQKDGLCLDCVRWENDSEWRGFLSANLSLLHYNEFLREVIAKYKYRGDYALADAFAPYVAETIKRLKYDIIVPIPLSQERLTERGFNQAKALVETAGMETNEVLLRLHTEKQSKKTRQERISLAQVFQVIHPESIKDKNILLIDDIYTTGSTLRHAAKILKQFGAAEVNSLTLAR
ncbi:ComF family protein [Bacillus sp. V5-8f]|uniref:ComF family protein n=1 Tax=Bacillus sp. V5-8f TaxID=2053044 RepID=UPI000C787D55|nr:ComF family protein [Bacillus sp. V5-8f]PLT35713.1 amidophosphoribosyltransferase [Bacillus sp. V5-8f]